MFTTLRKHQRWLMTLIAALTIIAFAWLYNTTDLDRVGTNVVAKIYGRDVLQVDIEKAVRNYQLALALGQFDLVRDLAGQARSEDEAANNFIWNLMVLRHQAEKLGVEPGAQEVVEKIKGLPVFQTEEQFDPVKYSTFLQQQLAPRGFTERQLEGVIRDSLRLAGVKSLVNTPAFVLPGEVEESLERVRPMNVEVLRWNAAAVAKDVQVSDDELKKAFEARSKDLQIPEKRSVRYVLFALTPDQGKLKGKDRVDALQMAATATGEFAEALADGTGDMAGLAAKKGLEVKVTPLFTPDAGKGGAADGDDGKIVAAAAGVAFRLPAGPGNYEIVQVGEDGYAVVEVAASESSRPMTFEEARADLRADLITQKRDAAVREASAAGLVKIREAMASGKPFAEAAKEAGLKPEKIDGLGAFDEKLDAAQRRLAAAAMSVPDGALGEFVPTPEGGFAVFLAGRGQADEKTTAKQRPLIEGGLLEGKQMLVFAQWLTMARQESGLQVLRPLM